MYTLNLKIMGDQAVSRGFWRPDMPLDLGDLSPAFDSIGRNLRQVSKEQLLTRGSRGGTTYPALKPATIKRKIKKGYPEPHTPLVASGRLRASVTELFAADHVQQISAKRMVWGTRVPYGIYHQLGGDPSPPQRRIIQLTREDLKMINQAIQKQMIQAIRGNR